jgi:large subunit ribosomal protein L18
MDRKLRRMRRTRRTRSKIKELGMFRLCVHKTPRHTYAQVIDPSGSKVLAAASTLEKDMKKDLKNTANIAAAAKVGQVVAERAKAAGINKVAFDRSGFKYHGRVKALANGARDHGLEI